MLGVKSELMLFIRHGRSRRHVRRRVRAMGVRRGEQRTTPLTIAATGTALFFPALAALVTAAVALDALDLATTALVYHPREG